jgi:hypothetical protein
MEYQKEAQQIYDKCYMIIMEQGEGLAEEIVISSLAKRFAHEILLKSLDFRKHEWYYLLKIDECLDNVK